jgi:hypothetical protein
MVGSSPYGNLCYGGSSPSSAISYMTSMTTPLPTFGGALNKKYSVNFVFNTQNTLFSNVTGTDRSMNCYNSPTNTWNYNSASAWTSRASTVGSYKYCTANYVTTTTGRIPQVGQCLKFGSYYVYVAQYLNEGSTIQKLSGTMSFITTYPNPAVLSSGTYTATTTSYYPSDHLHFRFDNPAHFTNIKTVLSAYTSSMCSLSCDIQGGTVQLGATPNALVVHVVSGAVSTASTPNFVDPTTYAKTGVNYMNSTSVLLQNEQNFPLILNFPAYPVTPGPIIINGDISVMSCDLTGIGGKLLNVCLLTMYSIYHYNGIVDSSNPYIINYNY